MMSLTVVTLFLLTTLFKLGSVGAIDFGDINITSSLKVYAMAGNNQELQWITVCFDGFNMPAANVACRQLGYVSAITYSYANPDTLNSYVYTSVQCPTVSNYELYGETHLLRCNLTGPVLATTTVDCKATLLTCASGRLYDSPYEGQVYLDKTGSVSPSDGQLEMYLDGKWHKICYSSAFNDAVATSVCRQYGYTGVTEKEPVNVIGRASLDFSNYSCKHDSFPCFSHCISKPYAESSTCPHVFLNCEFDIESIKYSSSGTQGLCVDHPNCPQCQACSSCTGLGVGVGLGTLFVTILVMVALIMCVWCVATKKCHIDMDPPVPPIPPEPDENDRLVHHNQD